MRLRIGLFAAAAAAVLVPLGAATSASADGDFHVRGVYYTSAQCAEAGTAGIGLWGPNFYCASGPGGYYYLYTH